MSTTTVTKPALMKPDLPLLYREASRMSERAQRSFFFLLGAELALLPVGAAIGLFGLSDWLNFNAGPITLPGLGTHLLPGSDVIAAALLTLALVLRLIRFFAHPERRWYQARAVAESAKSIGWRYAVGGRPFELSTSPEELSRRLRDRLIETLTDVHQQMHDVLARLSENKEDVALPGMQRVRAEPLPVRRQTYLQYRVVDQKN